MLHSGLKGAICSTKQKIQFTVLARLSPGVRVVLAQAEGYAAGGGLWRRGAGAAWGLVHPVGDGVVEDGIAVAMLVVTVRWRGAVANVQVTANAGEQGCESAGLTDLRVLSLFRYNEFAILCRRGEEVSTAGAPLHGQAQVAAAAVSVFSVFMFRLSSFCLSTRHLPVLLCVFRLWTLQLCSRL